jgi:LPXTG-motif cell wall-anchored protein
MNTNTILILGVLLIVMILYIMRRRVRQGRKKGTF